MIGGKEGSSSLVIAGSRPCRKRPLFLDSIHDPSIPPRKRGHLDMKIREKARSSHVAFEGGGNYLVRANVLDTGTPVTGDFGWTRGGPMLNPVEGGGFFQSVFHRRGRARSRKGGDSDGKIPLLPWRCCPLTPSVGGVRRRGKKSIKRKKILQFTCEGRKKGLILYLSYDSVILPEKGEKIFRQRQQADDRGKGSPSSIQRKGKEGEPPFLAYNWGSLISFSGRGGGGKKKRRD